jgi:hypothetical protein
MGCSGAQSTTTHPIATDKARKWQDSGLHSIVEEVKRRE